MDVLSAVWQFFQEQVLGMSWLNQLVGQGLQALGLDLASRWGGSLHFFLYDVIKITILLCTLIFLISYVQSYFPPERSRRILGRFHGIWANMLSALLGTVTPFCSCSSIPLFMGFTSAGLPIGVTFSFLISSPMVDLGSLVLLMSVFGAKVAAIYVVVGLVIAVVGGLCWKSWAWNDMWRTLCVMLPCWIPGITPPPAGKDWAMPKGRWLPPSARSFPMFW